MEKQKIYELLTNEIKQGIVKIDEPMRKHTNFKIGGNADVFVIAKNIEEIKCVIKFSKENNIPLAILGNGSNVLVSDKGIRGIVLQIGLKEIKVDILIIDFHAEATAEKIAMARFLDGKATIIFGTHTHVQTADEQILPNGTAYITDLGLTGVLNMVIGSDPARSIERQLTQLPIRSEVAEGKGSIQGIVVEADIASGKALSIERFTF